jgi:processive 1,2-diacylglycerol beta-glucosyltransferase
MITLRNKDTGELLGMVGDSELQILVDALEEESTHDTDYYINEETIDLLADRGASDALVGMLRRALGSREGVEIQWSRS